jgi:hypothetical protein
LELVVDVARGIVPIKLNICKKDLVIKKILVS